ncbi:MAG TPA: O-antigen ligase family protein [Solirubrobacteraceae bacterium]|nr:O-antigen ligase family protein [Solirubrobacteraceae bacterium]
MSVIPVVRPDRRRFARAGGHLIWIAGLAAVLAGVTYKLGVISGLLALAGLLAVPLLLNNSRAAFTAWITVIVIAENTEDWNISLFGKLYDKTPAYFSITFLLLIVAAGAALLDVSRPGREARSPGVFVPALVLVAIAIAFGFANAALGPGIAKSSVLGAVQNYGSLLLPPLILVNVIRTSGELRRLVGYLAALTVLKSAAGVVAVVGGFTTAEVGLGSVSYLAPAINWMEMVYLIAVAGSTVSGIRLPRWMLWSTPLVLASFVLGQRRSFWLAAVFALILVVVIASRRTSRRLLLPAVGLTVLIVYLATVTGVTGPVQGTLVSRATSLTPTSVTTNKEDRYRLAELNNVWPAIVRQPVEGLGIGVPWPERSPLPFEFQDNHYFTHFAALYWWMTCGLMGLAAYLLVLGTTIVTGLRLWWRAREPVERLTALSLGLGTVGLVIVELTTTVIPADSRGTALFATSVGILAVIHQLARERGSAFSLSPDSNMAQ